jgi:GMP synthase-like glutamine amidotransferase
MHIGILKAGAPPTCLLGRVPSYPEMVRSAFGSAPIYQEFDVRLGKFPVRCTAFDAYVITGSASSVYDGDAWIADLKRWLCALDPALPLIGICFGHQIMAEAYGGSVERCKHGWRGGLEEYSVCFNEGWMDPVDSFVLPIAHQDEVVEVPRTASVIAKSNLCANAVLSYRDRRAVSFQAHPEFTGNYAELLIDWYRRHGGISAQESARAKTSLGRLNDRLRVISWLKSYIRGAV